MVKYKIYHWREKAGVKERERYYRERMICRDNEKERDKERTKTERKRQIMINKKEKKKGKRDEKDNER